MDNSIYITDENGHEVKLNVYFTFDYEDTNYAICYEDGNEDELYPFKYDDDGHIYAVEDPEELSIINEVLEAFVGEEDEEDEKPSDNSCYFDYSHYCWRFILYKFCFKKHGRLFRKSYI